MPRPRKGEKKKDYLNRCIPIVTKEGKPVKQAAAICYSYWDSKDESFIKSYDEFINEEEVRTDKELREYTLTHKNDDRFEVKSKDFFKDFSVKPFSNEVLDKLKTAYSKLLDSIEQEDVNKLYDAIIKAERLDYTFGNIFTTKFSLVNVPQIDTFLNDDQRNSLKTSEKDFLLNNYSQLSKNIKTDILTEMLERSQVICCVIEALFYFIRKDNKQDYYEGMTSDEIVNEYEKTIEKASKQVSFSYEGPFSDEKRSSIISESEKAYWICEKNTKKFFIYGTVSVKNLYAEENIGGTKGMKLSLSTNSPNEDFSYFDMNELTKKIELFYKKVLSNERK